MTDLTAEKRIHATALNLLRCLEGVHPFAGKIRDGKTGGCLCVVSIASVDSSRPFIRRDCVVPEGVEIPAAYAGTVCERVAALIGAPHRRMSLLEGGDQQPSAAAIRGQQYLLAYSAPSWSARLCEFFVAMLAAAIGDLSQQQAAREISLNGNPLGIRLGDMNLSGLVPREPLRPNEPEH